jgi:hypothetical protein
MTDEHASGSGKRAREEVSHALPRRLTGVLPVATITPTTRKIEVRFSYLELQITRAVPHFGGEFNSN